MTKYIKITLFIIISMVLLSSCINNKFNEPDEAVYNTDIEATTTIAELVNLYEGALTYLDTNVVISGTVIANDKTGNFYKSIVIQDSTAGIEISLNAYELHNTYHIGDLIFVKCNGLYLGEYGGVVQLGAEYEGGIGRIEEPMIKDYLFKSEGGIPIKPKTFSLAAPNASYVNQLVILKDVQFGLNSLGETYGDAEFQLDRDIPVEDCDGNSVTVRTSGYADFARDTIATGNGNMIAVLSIYNGQFQLTLRDPSEVVFNNSRCGAVFQETFEGNLGAFNAYSVIGDNQIWEYSSSFDAAVMSGYDGGNFANEDWLISNAIDLSGYQNIVLNFRHAWNYRTSNGTNDVEVYMCTDYDGTSNPNTSGTWTKLTGINYPSGFDWTWVSSGDVDVSAFGGSASVFLAFKYRSSATDASTWEIDKISISIP
ncbi:MAG: DUF5689 domain-containing protein [Bacteroidales bacterium]|nr:DUF5689 domain-containing protein [Bacteroidales bacterium]